ncbi:phosphoenolpyruvate synthase [Clostridium sp. D2Q-14]|uniref:phosphoenolpyruvate synthase n=1 Tax=Anaeromonas gelatinilytica TaxID=2683194 RepID=UPI00193C79C9|nr:phosphoenolpyruvate synthase [Anaeromonas gelatinilytica]MBS4534727.1 phosphoenolpyruvate synthase [Anaeromonas gelatinilytica]
MHEYKYIKWFNEVNKSDIPIVGGKGANLGELTQKGINVPPGFCVTAKGYTDFIEKSNIKDEIKDKLSQLDIQNNDMLHAIAKEIRDIIMKSEMPEDIKNEIIDSYKEFSEKVNKKDPLVAIRSSATAEDLPEASFAGQQDTYLEIHGIEEILNHIRKCWASLWTARAIYYRENQGFKHEEVALSVVVQKMVNSGKAGVLFTANPINNNKNEIMINASWGLGEAVVSGIVTPDEYIIVKDSLEIVEKNIANKKTMVIKKKDTVGTEEVSVADILGKDKVTDECLSEDEVIKLARSGSLIEAMYKSNQDIEWAFDKDTKELYILQSRPITTLKGEEENMEEVKNTELKVLAKGLAAAPGIGYGKVVKIKDINEISRVKDGDILVTVMTNPDMVPSMRKAKAVVTDEGGRTCHAAIVSRELGVPCIVGANDATEHLEDKMMVTVDATRGVVYDGKVVEEEEETTNGNIGKEQLEQLVNQLAPITGTKIYMNLGEPAMIKKYKNLPFDGIGLMRTELIFTNYVGAHPMYLIKTGQQDRLINKMSEGITNVAQEIYPKPIVVRLSDFRTNEFRGLEGGDEVEPIESNPMIGWRGVSRYISSDYEEGFRLECKAIKKVRDEYGLINVYVMLPFVRTTWELKKVKEIMASEGLVQGINFKIWIMAEVPSVIFQAEEFAQLIDGFSIGSNDLTQLTLGADRDSGILNSMGYFDERNPAVKKAIATLIKAAHKHGKTVSICGQAPSLYPEFAEFLVREGIDSMSINPDTVAYTRRLVAGVEQRILLNNIRNSNN